MPELRWPATTGGWAGERAINRAHLYGIVPCRSEATSTTSTETASSMKVPGIELLRSLAEYEQVAGVREAAGER